jgi:hypothetical protein
MPARSIVRHVRRLIHAACGDHVIARDLLGKPFHTRWVAIMR